MRVITRTENIFKVTIYVPNGYYAKKGSILFFNHKNCISSHRIEVADKRVIFVLEFENIEKKDREEVKKYCRKQVEEMCRIEKMCRI